MKIVRIDPIHILPPPTFNIVELTQDQMEKLYALVGVTAGMELGGLGDKLANALDKRGLELSKYKVCGSNSEHVKFLSFKMR